MALNKPTKSAVYLKANESVEVRVRDLIGRMTLEEKIREMNFTNSVNLLRKGKFAPTVASRFFKGMGIGGLQDPRLAPTMTADAVNSIQRFLKNKTRLGIPTLMTSECLHGHMSQGATIFPQAIGLGSTWNTELLQEIASTIAKEARAVGVSQTLSPDLDLARDPRWGRVEETYGECPYLTGRMGVAYIKGMQGTDTTVSRQHLIVTLKHFAAHGCPEAGVNVAPVAVGPRELRELYLPPFKAAVVEAGALSVMPAYSEFDGVPCHANKDLLTHILREEWGFAGYTFSDYGGIHMLSETHKTAADLSEAGKQAVEAGLDLEAGDIDTFGDRLIGLVKKGKVDVALISQAASRVLRVKFLAGLFENPYAEPKEAIRIINCNKHRTLARQTAQESIILLKNEGNLLPLDKSIKSIAVIGPNADTAQLGDYSILKDEVVTPLAGIRKAITRKTKVNYAKGCGITDLSTDGFHGAVEAAVNSEVAIVVVGGASMITFGVGWGNENEVSTDTTCGESYDRTNLDLPGVQQQLVEAVVATGTPTIIVQMAGRPYAIPWIVENVPAVLQAWYPGEEGGNALADILFGDVNPSGKLPISVPKNVGQIPVCYNHKPSARGHANHPGSPEHPGRDYVFCDTKPLFEFGFGLSYTKFKYANLNVTPKKIATGGKVTVTVDVTNTGKREGKEVVQLYINDEVSSVTTRTRRLRGFRKIDLKPNETKTVEFRLTPADLSLINVHLEEVVEPGTFQVMVANLTKRFRAED